MKIRKPFKTSLSLAAAMGTLALAIPAADAATIFADQDSYVESGTTANFGTTEDLFVKLGGGLYTSSYTRTTWLHFSSADFSSSTAASLDLVVKSPGTTAGTVITLWGIAQGADGDANGAWAEGTIVGSNVLQGPTLTDGAATVNLGSVTASTENDDEGDVHTFDSAALLSFLQNDTNGEVSFLLQSNSAFSHTYYSKDNSVVDRAGPALTIAVPEPSSAALLLGLGSIALVLRRRK